jgi:hypothetical protein
MEIRRRSVASKSAWPEQAIRDHVQVQPYLRQGLFIPMSVRSATEAVIPVIHIRPRDVLDPFQPSSTV